MKERNNNITPKEKETIRNMRKKMDETRKKDPEKLREHLQAFNDAVLAIIMTIIVLEIKPPVHEVRYGDFISDIVVFIITFFIIAGFWYQLHEMFAYFIVKPNKLTTVLDFCLLVVVSLFPVMTKWIMVEHSTFSILNFGVIFLVAQIFRILLQLVGAKQTMKDSVVVQEIMVKSSRARIVGALLLNIFLIVLSLWLPMLSMILYIAFPLISFFMPDRTFSK